MSWLNTRTLLISGGVIGGAFLLFPRTAAKVTPVGNPFNTPAVQSVGDRYSTGGGSNTHLPAVGTPRGSVEKTASPQEKPSGVGTVQFKETHEEQKVIESGPVGRAFYKAQYGENNEKGK